MKTVAVHRIALGLLLAAVLLLPQAALAGTKTDVCHFADSHPGRVIRIAVEAVPAHEEHGDCLEYSLDESGSCGCPLGDLLATATFAARIDFPATTSWDPVAIQGDPAYAHGTLEGPYLVLRGKAFADYPVRPDACCDPQPIPAGIPIDFALGEDGTIWVFTDAPLPLAFMPLFGFPSSVNDRPTSLWVPEGFDLTIDELRVLWDQGLRVSLDWDDKFTTLPQFGMKLYADLRSRGLVSGPLSDLQVVQDTQVALLNQSGGRVAIGLARHATDCIGSAFWADDIASRWWPTGAAARCGTTEWGFTVTTSNPAAEWFAYAVAYGDNGTTQQVLWDGQPYVQHVNYGSKERYSTSPGNLPVTVSSLQQNVWSGNANEFVLVIQADSLEFTDVWESPTSGDVALPIVRYLETGWN